MDIVHVFLLLINLGLLGVLIVLYSKTNKPTTLLQRRRKTIKPPTEQKIELTNVHATIINKFIKNYSKPIRKPYIISIYGGSGSGKTFVASVITGTIKEMYANKTTGSTNNACKDVVILSQDSYYIGGNSETNYDIPSAIDFDLFTEHVKQLIAGNPIECPIYDFKTHSRKKETITIYPTNIIILEGILICTEENLRNLSNMRIFVDANESTQVFRRLVRDVNERGRTIEEVRKQYKRDVAPSYKQFVLPSAQYADMTINNNNDEEYVGLEAVLNHVMTVMNNVCKE